MAAVRKPVKAVATSRPAAKPAPRVAVVATPAAKPQTSEKVTSVAIMPVQLLEAATGHLGSAQEMTRDIALRSAESVRAAYDRTRIAAEETAGSVEKAFATASDGVKQLQAKAIDSLQAQALANFEISKSLTATKNPSEAITLASEHFRKQMEAVAAQGQQFAELSQKLVQEAMAPFGTTFSRAFGIKA